jgi:multidrug efflux pump subunit AcrB
VDKFAREECPEVLIKTNKFQLGPSSGAKIEARFMGEDSVVLRDLSEQAKKIMYTDPVSKTIRDDWRQRTKAINIRLSEARTRKTGITRAQINEAINATFTGSAVGVYREGDKLIPIVARAPERERDSLKDLHEVLITSPATGEMVPVEQISSSMSLEWENPIIYRRNRKRCITAMCDQKTGTADALFRRLRSQIEAIKLPDGYEFEWGGEYENSTKAQKKLLANIPLAMCVMFLISVFLFNTLRHPIIIFLGLPLSIIGVSVGLLVTGQPFGFMSLLGFLSLSGMLIKNEIVLLDQIELEINGGKRPYRAVIESAISRVRPVSMAAFTTVLGMTPLIFDPFFASMAVTIMAGLTFATVLTLVLVPVVYSTLFKIKPEPLS